MQHTGSIIVGGRRLAFQAGGAGAPTIVFECGDGDSSAALAQLAQRTQAIGRVLLYDRAGLGQSDPAPRPRTIDDAVADLHALLHSSAAPAPFLLVGHSYGGLITRRYAALHWAELAGLILLDIPHPQQALRELRLLPAPAPSEPPALSAHRTALLAEWHNPLGDDEGFDRPASAAQVLASEDLGDLPLVVITAGLDEWEPGFPADVARALEQDWQLAQRELLGLSRQSRQVIATNSTHAIQDCEPELVLAAIQELAHIPRETRRHGG